MRIYSFSLRISIQIRLKRAYEPPEQSDGIRLLVERLWPRGISKEKAKIDIWLKDAAPSTELRKWFDHDPSKWNDFKERYFEELEHSPESIKQLKELMSQGTVTFVFASKEERYNNSAALKEYLESRTAN